MKNGGTKTLNEDMSNMCFNKCVTPPDELEMFDFLKATISFFLDPFVLTHLYHVGWRPGRRLHSKI